MPGWVGRARHGLLGLGLVRGAPGLVPITPGTGMLCCYLLDRDSRKSSSTGPDRHWE